MSVSTLLNFKNPCSAWINAELIHVITFNAAVAQLVIPPLRLHVISLPPVADASGGH